jgi:hypothetical protein
VVKHRNPDERTCRPEYGVQLALTNAPAIGSLGTMAPSPPRLDPDRRRRRIELLAALAGARSREAVQPRRLRGARLRELIASRRRLVN